MKIKTSTLSGAALDWAITKYKNILLPWGYIRIQNGRVMWRTPGNHETAYVWYQYSPSTDWAQGGPIIEREMLAPEPLLDTNCALIKWRCRNWKGDGSDFYGPTPLIAAMRCFVASKLGDEVDIPEELL